MIIQHLKTVEKEISESVVNKLQILLEKAKNGEITELLAIYKCTDGTWDNTSTETLHFSEWIGRLEITKLDWIAIMKDNRNEA